MAISPMTVSLATPLSQIKLSPGSAIAVSGLTWSQYQALRQELGDEGLSIQPFQPISHPIWL